MTQNSIKTTCPYCGVGCGIEATIDDAVTHKVTIQGDSNHPANFGKLCSKGATLGDTVSLENRLLYPEINGQRVDWKTALNAVAEGFTQTIKQYGPDSVAFYVSGQLLTEEYYVANKLMKGFIGSANIDTNSRLCMSSAVIGYKRAFGADSVPCNYEDLEQANLIILTGSNAAWCHPILFQRMRRAKDSNPELKIVVIDPRFTSSCDIADLHLALKPGTDAVLFNGLLTYLDKINALDQHYINSHTEQFPETLTSAQMTAPNINSVADICGLPEVDIRQLYDWFAKTPQTVTVYSQGINQSSSGSDKCNAIINCHLATGKLGKPGTGPFSFTGQPNAMGGREVGGLSSMLAAHMDLENPDHVDLASRFWKSDKVANKQGLKAIELFDAIEAGKIKAVWIIATNPVVSLPNADKVKKALEQCELVVVSDCIKATDTMDCANIRLPATGWSEKNGTVTNSERRISRQRPLFEASGEAKPDWWIISQVASRMGFAANFDYYSSADIFKEHAALSGFENDAAHHMRDFDISALANMTASEYDNLQPIQWPVTQNNTQGTDRLFTNGQFYTANQKARFIPIIPRPPVNAIDQNYPFTLNTGRLRDQWHTMTRTALAAKLNSHRPEPFVEIHPLDAEKLNLQDHSLAKIASRWGDMIARIDITEHQQQGSLFVPMHWTAQLSSHGRVGTVVNPVVDPDSGQPESKQTPVRITPYQPQWYAMILTRNPVSISDAEYFVKIKGEHSLRYEIAGESDPKQWTEWSRTLLNDTRDKEPDWLEYTDPAVGYYRCAKITDNRLQGCIFISPSWRLPEPGWLASLFEKEAISRAERLSLLSGLPPKGQEDIGRLVCSCFNVGEKTILKTITARNLVNVEQIGECLSAGTGCGSCLPELKGLLQKQ